MLNRILHISFLIGLFCLDVSAQVERLRIETYYISDAGDATDTIGGQLDEGTTTYRIYADLMPGSKLLSIYGEPDQPLVFTSTAPFFNHAQEGVTFGKDMSRNRFEIGTVALDSYITMGQCSRSFSSGAYFGIPKEEDFDGSIIGGVHNDGGSGAIASGLLINQNSQMGVPLTTSDGLTLSTQTPGSWVGIGFVDPISQLDTTIFGSTDLKKNFIRTNVSLRNEGTIGMNPNTNEVLVAQLTTKGELTFSINLELEILDGDVTKTIRYVSRNENLKSNEIFSPLLTYPYSCGCKDPAYLEANPDLACEDNTQCKTLVVYGCMDSMACNYSPEANFNLQDLCCYVGYCSDLDLSIVCPDLQPRVDNQPLQITAYPNPVINALYLEADHVAYSDIDYTIYDMYGRVLQEGVTSGQEKFIDVQTIPPGCYGLRLRVHQNLYVISFIKI